ncbi:hypothetical protein BP6252_12957 [Coleophoma cylindrospora]|uniref:Uncharacterized protein n=1 Tax=Coleophoma cylindrospora TaxID=1849047 RepID=A0A3D8QDY4_9HELO|nr:hypothetical protein BP6252_12957 [Coleophoma cylindrospora]
MRLLTRRAPTSLPIRRSLTTSRCPSLATSRPVLAQHSLPTLLSTAQRRHESSSTIQGTIGKGEAGVSDEVARSQDALKAPEHLNAKEREIFDQLARELDPVELDVRRPSCLHPRRLARSFCAGD